MAWGGASQNNEEEEEEEERGAVFKRQVFVLEGLGQKEGREGADKEGEKANQAERLGP